MKGTTLTELIENYDWQAIALADRQAPLAAVKKGYFMLCVVNIERNSTREGKSL